MPPSKTETINVNWQCYAGVAGMAPDENPRVITCHRLLEWPMIAAAICTLGLWYLNNNGHELETFRPVHLAIWGLFVVEAILLCALCDQPLRYLRDNWLNLVIIATGIPLLFHEPGFSTALRTLRLLVLVSLLIHVLEHVKHLLSRNTLSATLIGTAIIVVMAGFIMAAVDPGISTPGEGVWWALVTVTTVGYGDVVPTTVTGRVFASVLIFIGLGLLSLLTATIAAALISRQESIVTQQQREEEEQMLRLEVQLKRIEGKLDQLLEEARH